MTEMAGMRIISGIYGGLTIKAVAGTTTRPTTDRVREAWASTMLSLLPEGFDELRVLDAFAGSGALGLEALSRGAASVVFCENNRNAAKALRENIDRLGVPSSGYSVLQTDVFTGKALSELDRLKPFDAVLLDPPYALPAKKIYDLVGSLSARGLLSEGCLISYEHAAGKTALSGKVDRKTGHSAKQTPADAYNSGLELISCKTYGSTAIEYFVRT
ncbi:MAG TPA: 16S rRNA (guanine(966)-N(2))-methyltransferase RsmD [Coriobacteriia bacterium]|nr:16S rRNA (guanine(966)-N(2))-methyltransferase RsmD [Coriobacteriia bacterium]